MGTALVIFGGVNFFEYCKSEIYMMEISQSTSKKMIRDHQNPEVKDVKNKTDKLEHLKSFLDNQDEEAIKANERK